MDIKLYFNILNILFSFREGGKLIFNLFPSPKDCNIFQTNKWFSYQEKC